MIIFKLTYYYYYSELCLAPALLLFQFSFLYLSPKEPHIPCLGWPYPSTSTVIYHHEMHYVS